MCRWRTISRRGRAHASARPAGRALKGSPRPGRRGLLELEKPQKEARRVHPGDASSGIEPRRAVAADEVDEAALEGDGDVAAQSGGDPASVRESEGLAGSRLGLGLESRTAHQPDGEV